MRLRGLSPGGPGSLADGLVLLRCCGPRGIRTLDLLNAIETRSQLRYGPILCYHFFRNQYLVQCLITGYSLNSGPEGIRTPDLLSAIEARSQLRYRPINKAFGILMEGEMNVKQRFAVK